MPSPFVASDPMRHELYWDASSFSGLSTRPGTTHYEGSVARFPGFTAQCVASIVAQQDDSAEFPLHEAGRYVVIPQTADVDEGIIVALAGMSIDSAVSMWYQVVATGKTEHAIPSITIHSKRLMQWKQYAVWVVHPDPLSHPDEAAAFISAAIDTVPHNILQHNAMVPVAEVLSPSVPLPREVFHSPEPVKLSLDTMKIEGKRNEPIMDDKGVVAIVKKSDANVDLPSTPILENKVAFERNDRAKTIESLLFDEPKANDFSSVSGAKVPRVVPVMPAPVATFTTIPFMVQKNISPARTRPITPAVQLPVQLPVLPNLPTSPLHVKSGPKLSPRAPPVATLTSQRAKELVTAHLQKGGNVVDLL